ncbi:Deacetylases, including yeast histone deacetylase and acetoin utilization protein [hydrothermal vent metagenome]|uniref:Deacetylases, including yeast histone deacetylase and acetoin utilization protein n=1 Tax=hydrothermal vent metagenome TaxID=652676 RepID=A0A3B1BEG1_9ZZZZ
MSQVAIYYDPVFLEHGAGTHPECAARLEAIVPRLRGAAFAGELVWPTPKPARLADIELVHTAGYTKFAEAEIKRGVTHLDADTTVCPRSWEAALMAAGSGTMAVDQALGGEYNRAFIACRPPGHHAEADRAMGFCIFNNVAIAARHATENHGLDRVAIIDFDVHHGNGTQNSFYNDPKVYYVSTHQEYHYPGTGSPDETGEGEAKGTNLNFPLSEGTTDEEILSIFDKKIIPALTKFEPRIVFISAGFDAHRDDPLAGLSLTEDGYKVMTERLRELAEKSASGRMISFLEGGYNVDALARSVEAHVKEMTLQ